MTTGEQGNAERRPCKNPDCENTVTASSSLTFCFNCEARVLMEGTQLSKDLDKVLSLEAQFVEYCREHGLPNPHD